MASSVYPDVNSTLRSGLRSRAASASCLPGAIDPHDFLVVVCDADEAEQIGRLQRHLGGQPALQPFPPGRFRHVFDRIGSAVEAGAHQARDRFEIRKRRDVPWRGADVGLEVGGNEARVRLDPFEHARDQGLFKAAIAEPADGKDRERHQEDHGNRKPRGQRQALAAALGFRRHAIGQNSRGGFVVSGPIQHCGPAL